MTPLWQRFPRLMVLANACFAVPVLIYGADRREYFLNYQCDGLDLVVIALAIALVPGLLVAAGEVALVRLCGPRAHALVAGLLCLGAGQIVAGWGLGLTGARAVAAALSLAALAVRVGRTLPRTRAHAGLMLAACLAMPAYLLGVSDLAPLVWGARPVPLAVTVAKPHPVVFLLFDGMPLAPLLDAAHGIDAALYPNLARLARTATFYRNASCNFGYTDRSLPSLLTGRLPGNQKLAVAAEYPQTLFTLLAGAYRFHVTEWGSAAMFPDGIAPGTRIAPRRLDRWGAIAADLSITLPMVYSASLTDADLADMVQHLQFFGRKQGKDTDDAFDRIATFRRWLQTMPAGDPRTFYYAHIGVPHDPWNLMPDGTRYPVPEESAGLKMVMPEKDMVYFVWTRDEWTVHQAYQRLVFQLMFCDRLLGELVARLDALKLTDDAVLVVTTDHGSAVIPGSMPRNILMPQLGSRVPPNYREIVPVPLFVKLPGQKTGEVSDRNAELIDVVPTLAQALGVAVPWPMDGAPLDAPRERPEKTFMDYDLSKFTLPAAFPDRFDGLAKRAWFDPGTPADWIYRLKPFGDLVGRELALPDRPEPGLTITLESQPGVVRGRVRAHDLDGEVHVALVTGRRVHAVTRLQQLSRTEGTFLAFPLETSTSPSARLLRVKAGRVTVTRP